MSKIAQCKYLLSFTCSYHFEWPWPYFKVMTASNSLNWNLYFSVSSDSSKFKVCMIAKHMDLIIYYILCYFVFQLGMYSIEITDAFSDLTRKLTIISQLAFFHQQAAKKGASQTIIGLIFSCFELWIFLSAPIFGNFVSIILYNMYWVMGWLSW